MPNSASSAPLLDPTHAYRAAAIDFAREGADVVINYLPAEESDARDVIKLIRAEKRKAVAGPPTISRTKGSAKS